MKVKETAVAVGSCFQNKGSAGGRRRSPVSEEPLLTQEHTSLVPATLRAEVGASLVPRNPRLG